VLFDRRVLLLRPLLGVSRPVLRGFLGARAIPHADDPTNADMAYERVRIRAGRPEIRSATLKAAHRERARLAAAAAAFIENAVRLEDGLALISADPAMVEQDVTVFALRHLAATLDGAAHPASPATGVRLAALLQDDAKGKAFAASRLRFERVGDRIQVGRDPRHAGLPFAFGRTAPFDLFCPQSFWPLADALAKVMGAPPFTLFER
jgi:tRNA(Ile)-lysidine synthase